MRPMCPAHDTRKRDPSGPLIARLRLDALGGKLQLESTLGGGPHSAPRFRCPTRWSLRAEPLRSPGSGVLIARWGERGRRHLAGAPAVLNLAVPHVISPHVPGAELRADDLTYGVDGRALSLGGLEDNVEDRDVLSVEEHPDRAIEESVLVNTEFEEYECGLSVRVRAEYGLLLLARCQLADYQRVRFGVDQPDRLNAGRSEGCGHAPGEGSRHRPRPAYVLRHQDIRRERNGTLRCGPPAPQPPRQCRQPVRSARHR